MFQEWANCISSRLDSIVDIGIDIPPPTSTLPPTRSIMIQDSASFLFEVLQCAVELETNLREDFTITVKALAL